MFRQRRYGLLNNGNSNGAQYHAKYRRLMQDYTPADSPFYTSCGFDVIDNRNQRTTQFPDRPIDRVSGYTIKQLESSLYGTTTWTKWRDNIKNQRINATSGNVDKMFANWN